MVFKGIHKNSLLFLQNVISCTIVYVFIVLNTVSFMCYMYNEMYVLIMLTAVLFHYTKADIYLTVPTYCQPDYIKYMYK